MPHPTPGEPCKLTLLPVLPRIECSDVLASQQHTFLSADWMHSAGRLGSVASLTVNEQSISSPAVQERALLELRHAYLTECGILQARRRHLAASMFTVSLRGLLLGLDVATSRKSKCVRRHPS